MIEVGDLVKYKLKARYRVKEKRDNKGVWLVVNVETDTAFEHFGELVTLKQGNEQRLTYHFRLNKISSCR